jgi:hypothetical protein
MSGDFLPDYGLALLERKAKQPVELNPLFVEDVGRVDVDTYTMSGKIKHDGAWHLASIDFPVGMLPKLLMALPAKEKACVEQLLRRRFDEAYSERLPAPLSLAVTARLGDPQQNGNESYVPFVGMAFAPGPDVTFVEEPAAADLPSLAIDMGQEVLLFRVNPELGQDAPGLGPLGTVAAVFFACLAGPFAAKPRAKGWTCFIAMLPNPAGLNLSIGVTGSVPGALLDQIQSGLESLGTEVNRGMTTARHARMLPLAHIDADGCFFLLPPGAKAPPEGLIRNIGAATDLRISVREIVPK